MGLDIRVYTNVKLVNSDFDDYEDHVDNCEEGNLTVLQPNEAFPLQGDGLIEGAYSYEKCEHILSRSYSGWSILRDELAFAVGYTPITEFDLLGKGYDTYQKEYILMRPYQAKAFTYKEGLLNEILNFSDCEGIINNRCCKKIYDDLLKVDKNLLADYSLNTYTSLVEGFKLASTEEGVVQFD